MDGELRGYLQCVAARIFKVDVLKRRPPVPRRRINITKCQERRSSYWARRGGKTRLGHVPACWSFHPAGRSVKERHTCVKSRISRLQATLLTGTGAVEA